MISEGRGSTLHVHPAVRAGKKERRDMIWSESSHVSVYRPEAKEERAGTATVLFSCQPLHAPEAVWELPKIEVPFSVGGDILEFGGNYEALQQAAKTLHDATCLGHQGDHHYMVTAEYTYTG